MPRSASPHSEARKETGRRVREMRLAAGHTQQDLAVEAGLTVGTIYWLEREGRGSLDTVLSVAKALECEPGDLLA